MAKAPGILTPIIKAMVRFTAPAMNPLTAAIWVGSVADTFLVRLLSIPQAKQAPMIARLPQAVFNSGLPVHDSRSPPATIAAIPEAIRRSKLSLKTNQARVAVNTPSRLRSNDAEDAGVCTKPIISSAGPITPPARIALANQGRSLDFRLASGASAAPNKRRSSRQIVSPQPELK